MWCERNVAEVCDHGDTNWDPNNENVSWWFKDLRIHHTASSFLPDERILLIKVNNHYHGCNSEWISVQILFLHVWQLQSEVQSRWSTKDPYQGRWSHSCDQIDSPNVVTAKCQLAPSKFPAPLLLLRLQPEGSTMRTVMCTIWHVHKNYGLSVTKKMYLQSLSSLCPKSKKWCVISHTSMLFNRCNSCVKIQIQDTACQLSGDEAKF